MYFSSVDTNLIPTDDAEYLRGLLSELKTNASKLALQEAENIDGYTWLAQLSNGEEISGQGRLSIEPTNSSISLFEMDKIMFFSDRVPYFHFVEQLPETIQSKCQRKTFDKDCRNAHAQGLYDEQAWCEAAYERDGHPSAPTAYLVSVTGSKRFLGYFNFQWEKDDLWNIKCCQDIASWSNTYIPHMWEVRNVNRWVFLEPETYEYFCNTIPKYKKYFVLDSFPFDEFNNSKNNEN